MNPHHIRIALACLLFACPLGSVAQRAMIRAIDPSTGMGIPDAVLVLGDSGSRARSDASGWIQMDTLEEGIYEAVLTAEGYTSHRVRLEVTPLDPFIRKEVFLEPFVVNLPAFEVTTELTDADQDALAKRQALLPVDQISGEALQDITQDGLGEALEKVAGVTVDSDSGNVSGINIRGAGPRQTRVTLDGQSVAGGGGRGTTRGARAMGQIPREFISRIQVMKAPTPDMDADAIGGTVDLQTSRVANTKKPRSSLALRSAWQEAGDAWNHRINLAHAQPFQLGDSASRLGILVAANAARNDRVQDDIRVLNQWPERKDPATGLKFRTLDRLRIGQRDNSNESAGFVLNSDLQLNKRHGFQLKAMFNQGTLTQSTAFHSIDFIRGKIVSLEREAGSFTNMSLEKQFIEKQIEDESGSLVFGSEHKLGDWFLEQSIGYSFAQSDSSDGVNGIFRTGKDVDGSYALLPVPERPAIELYRVGSLLDADALQDPAPYLFTRYDLIDDSADDEELALRVNLSRTWDSEERKWTFKSGAKARLREADNGQDRVKYFPVSGAGFSLAEVAGSGPESVFRQIYPLGPDWSSQAMQDRFAANPADFQPDPLITLIDSLASDFTVSESIYATYGMIQMESDKWVMITGVRLERTDSETSGYETITMKDESGERIVEVNPVSLSDTYDMFFPGFHLLYRVNLNWVIRGSLTRTLQRPDFRDLSPSMRVDLDTKRIRAGNPELDPFDAKAVDIGTDFVINEWSSASIGLFYKRIDDFIVDVETDAEYLGESGFILSRPVNGSPADLLGLEAAASTKLPFLPAPFEDTDLSVNYTLTDSSAAYPGYPGETIMLPKQVRQTISLDLRWRFNNWSLSWRARYRGEQLNDLIKPGQDQINRGFWSYSLGCNYKLNDTLSFSIGLANLNRPDRVSYQGDPLHTVSNNAGSRSYSIGLNMKL